jgi:two-component system, sensor histidine kinase and response regulator
MTGSPEKTTFLDVPTSRVTGAELRFPGGRFIEAISCLPNGDASMSQLRRLFRTALGVMLALTVATWFSNSWYEAIALSPFSIRIFNIAFTLAAIAGSFVVSARRWRFWAMAYCLIMVTSFTLAALMIHDEEPLFVMFLVLLLDTSIVVPWGGRCQGWLALVSMGCFVLIAAVGLVRKGDIPDWIALQAAAALSVSLAALKVYLGKQRGLIGDLKQREVSLREENAARVRAEEQLRREIGVRENAEVLARKGEAILRKVLETSLDVIIIQRFPELSYLYVNEQFRATGYTPEDTKGKRAADLNIFADHRQADEMMAIARATGRLENFELDIRNKSGLIVPYLLSAVIAEIDGEECLISMSRDMTQRKQMEQDLITAREDALAASRAKSEFLSSMSHEIRTPMNAVLGMADLLIDTKLNGEQRRYLDVMVANGNSLLELINSILDLARIESGRMQIEQTEFDLVDLIDKTISTFGVQAHSKGLELIARIAPGVPTHLIGDPLRVRQILINFLGNAIKFTERGEVMLQVDRVVDAAGPAELRFVVSDTGIGIAPTKLKEIFSKFTQADSSTTRKYGGTGLGLAIAERLVKMMHGTISLESELNMGSKFSFTANFGLATRVMSPTAHVVLNLDHHRVLVVDDNQINRLIAREMISNCGAEVSEAESGEDALIAIRQASDQGKPYRIILLDMRMPGMNGIEVAQRIRDEHLPTEPLILMLSSDDLKPQLAQLKELCLDAYLVKPITRKELFDAIGRVIQAANRHSADALPVRKEESLAATESACETGPAYESEPIRILVADDSADNRLLIGAYLRREPYQIDFAENGKIAIDKFKSNQYGMVLMDVQMPEIDGLEATRIIRRWEKDNHRTPTPIIALTASALEEDEQRTRAAGCDQHLSKPVKKSVLLQAIRMTSARARESQVLQVAPLMADAS